MKLLEEPVTVYGPQNGLVIRRVDCRDPKTKTILNHYFEVITALVATRKNGTFQTIEEALEWLERQLQNEAPSHQESPVLVLHFETEEKKCPIFQLVYFLLYSFSCFLFYI